jgi:hypothetical protein
MNEQKKTKKNFGRAIILMATLGTFLGLTSLPAMAVDWTIEVNVSDSTPPSCTDPITDPYWSPASDVTYMSGNDVDLYMSPGLVLFEDGLGLTTGWDNCNSVTIYPSGEVQASVSGLDAELSMEELDCTTERGLCSAELLTINNNSIMGTIDASLVSSTGLKTGTLSVIWTPAG